MKVYVNPARSPKQRKKKIALQDARETTEGHVFFESRMVRARTCQWGHGQTLSTKPQTSLFFAFDAPIENDAFHRYVGLLIDDATVRARGSPAT